MTDLQESQVFGSGALLAGIVVSFFLRRISIRGWIAVVLLMVTCAAWALIDSADSPSPSRLPMFVTFLFSAPISIYYALRARHASDRVFARAAFAGSLLVLVFLLFMV